MKKSAIYQTKRADAPHWFNKWVQSPRAFWGFGVAVGICLVLYILNAALGRVHPASPWGIGYGVAATVLVAAVLAYSIRRRTIPRRLGRTWFYLQVHVYGGAIFLLLVFMHVGFQVPQGILTWWLWLVSIWVVFSGLLGIVLQKWIPTLLNDGLAVEVHYARIPELAEEIRARAEALVETADYAIRSFYQKKLAASLAGPQFSWRYFVDITGGVHARTEPFRYVRGLLPPEEQARLDELQQLYETKLELDAHYSLQKALRAWLVLHVPTAAVLVVLLVLHLFAVLYY